jgi:hypothetical protein
MLEAIKEHHMPRGSVLLGLGLLFGPKRMVLWTMVLWAFVTMVLPFINPWIIASNESDTIESMKANGYHCAHYED